jgi:hypothetical protein
MLQLPSCVQALLSHIIAGSGFQIPDSRYQIPDCRFNFKAEEELTLIFDV